MMIILEVLQQNYSLVIAFFLIAIVYSSVGFGGGSSYLALLSLTSLAFVELRAISLLCNVVVVSGSTLLYIKKGLLDWKKVIPLVVFSVPLAFLGGYLKIEQAVFFILLAITLIIAALLMLFGNQLSKNQTASTTKNALIGSSIGFISGMVGIGGGVFLSPILHLTKWDAVIKIAATTSFFILVNSIAGLLGQMQNDTFTINKNLTFVLLIAVFIGGQIGSRMTINVLQPKTIKRLTAVLILFIGFRILFKTIGG